MTNNTNNTNTTNIDTRERALLQVVVILRKPAALQLYGDHQHNDALLYALRLIAKTATGLQS